jgi:hypothetical protein
MPPAGLPEIKGQEGTQWDAYAHSLRSKPVINDSHRSHDVLILPIWSTLTTCFVAIVVGIAAYVMISTILINSGATRKDYK